MTVTNYELRKTRAQYFGGPSGGSDNNFRTIPEVLRAVADWIEENNIQDPEIYDLLVRTEFSGQSNDYYGEDPYRQVVTLYYCDNPQPTLEQKTAHYEVTEQELREEGKL